MSIPISDQIQCIRREIAMRKRVYPRRVAEGRMQQFVADREFAHMAAVLQTLESLELPDRQLTMPGFEGSERHA